MADETGPRGFTRVYVDLEPETNDKINAHCKAQGITKKHFFYRLATDFFSGNTMRNGKHGTKQKRK